MHFDNELEVVSLCFVNYRSENQRNRVQLSSSSGLLKCEHWAKVQLADNVLSEVTACSGE